MIEPGWRVETAEGEEVRSVGIVRRVLLWLGLAGRR